MKGDSEQQVNQQLLISGQVFGGFSEGYCDLDSLFSISKRQPYTDSIFNVWKRNGLSEFYCPCSPLHFLRGVRKLLIASASFDKMQKLESQPHQDTSSVIGNPNAHSWNMFLPFQWHVVALWNRTAMNFHFFHFYFQCHVVLHWKRTALNFHFLFARLFWWPSWLRALRQEIASDELAANCFE